MLAWEKTREGAAPAGTASVQPGSSSMLLSAKAWCCKKKTGQVSWLAGSAAPSRPALAEQWHNAAQHAFGFTVARQLTICT